MRKSDLQSKKSHPGWQLKPLLAIIGAFCLTALLAGLSLAQEPLDPTFTYQPEFEN